MRRVETAHSVSGGEATPMTVRSEEDTRRGIAMSGVQFAGKKLSLRIETERIMKKNKRSVVQTIVGLAFVALAAWGWNVYKFHTVVVWWWPVVWGLVIAVTTTPFLHRMWGWVFDETNRVAEVVIHVGYATVLGCSFLLLSNYYWADAATTYEERVSVQEKHHRKRTSRMRRGGTRKTESWSLSVVFADGTEKELGVSRSVYDRIPDGREATFAMRKGFWGFPVVCEVGK